MKQIGQFLMLLLFVTFISSCFSSGSKQNSVKKKPNILFIFSDDHAFQAISAYGGRLKDVAPTPNIDRIADEGMLFNRCLVTNSICGPSRATIISGKYGHLNGFVSNEGGTRFDGSQLTFPKVLQQGGYKTGIVGKWHLGSDPTGFDYWEVLPDQGFYYNPKFITPDGVHEETGYVTEIITDKAIDFLNNASQSDQPFMLMVQHKAPHREWEPGPNELSLYKDVNFPEPETMFDTYEGRGSAAHEQDMTIAVTMRMDRDLKMFENEKLGTTTRLNEEQEKAWDAVYDPIINYYKEANLTGDDLVRFKYQRYMQDYLACIAGVDKSVGKILNYLKEKGLDENTIVVYSSDQGFYLGEHGWFDKRFMYEESLRTPLLVKWPGVTKPGSKNSDIVSNLDFGETFLDMAGLEVPEEMQGESFVPILKGNTPNDWRKNFYYHYYEYPSWHMVKRHYGIATERYKLIHFYYDVDEWELYDLQEDPMEMKNVYNDANYLSVRENLHQQLNELRMKYKDSDELTQEYLQQSLKNLKHYQ
ncbi:sulfatase family protein [Carboxylicivirga caseinilyticus]|uniref:sulfatase family protein n=1 Tax=Carboxylicivirga caseinilyticus TaxID=3417572 RepID=UPI003D3572F4|nr:sulfatase [Marinilabiliaceae bacterium A049]